jgi:hypothetical protein
VTVEKTEVEDWVVDVSMMEQLERSSSEKMAGPQGFRRAHPTPLIGSQPRPPMCDFGWQGALIFQQMHSYAMLHVC